MVDHRQEDILRPAEAAVAVRAPGVERGREGSRSCQRSQGGKGRLKREGQTKGGGEGRAQTVLTVVVAAAKEGMAVAQSIEVAEPAKPMPPEMNAAMR